MSNLTLVKPQSISAVQKGLVITKNFIIKQSPIILTCAAVGGVITTGVLAVRGGIRANELVKAVKDEKAANGEDISLTAGEYVQTTWKAYAPAIISGGLTIGAIVASAAISQKRQAALAGLYALSETALKEYQDKINKTYGEKDAQKIRDEINSDHVASAGIPPWDEAVLPVGEVLCFDKFSGRYFTSSVQKIQSAENAINAAIYSGDMCASLNEFYGYIDSKQLPQCTMGDSVGWNLDTPCKLYFTSCLTSDMKPCLVIDYSNGFEPTPRYRDI